MKPIDLPKMLDELKPYDEEDEKPLAYFLFCLDRQLDSPRLESYLTIAEHGYLVEMLFTTLAIQQPEFAREVLATCVEALHQILTKNVESPEPPKPSTLN